MTNLNPNATYNIAAGRQEANKFLPLEETLKKVANAATEPDDEVESHVWRVSIATTDWLEVEALAYAAAHAAGSGREGKKAFENVIAAARNKGQ